MDFGLLFAHASSLSALIPFLLSFLPGKRSVHNLQYLRWLMLASLLADGLSLTFIQYGINTWFIVNIFFIVQFALFYFTFKTLLSSVYLHTIFWIFFSFSFFNYFFVELPTTFNSFTAYAGGILMLVLALLYLQKLLIHRPSETIMALPLLWVSYGMLIYYAGTLFLFLFNNYLVKYSPQSHQYIWILHNLLNITKNTFLSIALWKSYKAKM